MQHLSLQRQIEVVFKQIKEELAHLSSGVVFIQIRNNVVGKFGVRHFPVESKEGRLEQIKEGLSDPHWKTFKQTAIESLRLKKNWTHGEISFEFAMRKNLLSTSVQFESNYNMANLMALK